MNGDIDDSILVDLNNYTPKSKDLVQDLLTKYNTKQVKNVKDQLKLLMKLDASALVI